MPLKPHVCDVEGCYRSFHTAKGVEHHKRRGNHDPSSKGGNAEVRR